MRLTPLFGRVKLPGCFVECVFARSRGRFLSLQELLFSEVSSFTASCSREEACPSLVPYYTRHEDSAPFTFHGKNYESKNYELRKILIHNSEFFFVAPTATPNIKSVIRNQMRTKFLME